MDSYTSVIRNQHPCHECVLQIWNDIFDDCGLQMHDEAVRIAEPGNWSVKKWIIF